MSVTEVTDVDDLMKSSTPVVIFFYSAMCGHCKVMHEPYASIAKKHSDVKFYKIESENIPDSLDIMGYPHFKYIEGGTVKREAGGEMEESELESKLFSSGGLRRRRSRRLRGGVRKTHRALRRNVALTKNLRMTRGRRR